MLKKTKKYLIPALAVFAVLTIVDMVIHNVLMKDLYLANSNLFRPMAEIKKHCCCFMLANLIFSVAFCYIYSKGHEKKDSIVQGIRFAAWMILLITVPFTIVSYTIYPHPKNLELTWLLAYSVEMLLAGITVAMVFPKIK